MSIPKPRVAPPPALDLVAASFDEAPSAETLAEPLLRREAPSPRLPNATPRSPVSIPKPRVAASSTRRLRRRRSPSRFCGERAPSPRPSLAGDMNADVRLSVTFRNPRLFRMREGKARTLVPPAAYRTTKRRRTRASPSSRAPFSPRKELAEIWRLGWPMGVSYFCRMGMASTDSVMVDPLRGRRPLAGGTSPPARSDMVTTLMVVPPLAFNRVLNALCGRRLGRAERRWRGVWLQQSVVWLGITMAPCLCGFSSSNTSFTRWVLRNTPAFWRWEKARQIQRFLAGAERMVPVHALLLPGEDRPRPAMVARRA